MKKLTKTASLLTLAAMLFSTAAYAADYTMVTPTESRLETFESCEVSTSDEGVPATLGMNGSVNNVNGEGIVELDDNKCYHIGQLTSGKNGYGLGFSGDADEQTGNYPLFGIGKLEFDFMLDTSAAEGGASTQLVIYGDNGIKVGSNDYTAAEVGKIFLTRQNSNSFSSQYALEVTTDGGTSNKNFGCDANGNTLSERTYYFTPGEWYNMKIYFSVPEKCFRVEVRDNGELKTYIEQPLYFKEDNSTNNSSCLSESDFAAFAGFRVKTDKEKKLYFDNVKTTREAFVVGTPSVSNDNGALTAKVNIMNETRSKTTTPVLLLGVYDALGKLVDVNFISDEIGIRGKDGGNPPVSEEIDCSVSADGGETVRAFVWNTLDKIVPYTATPLTNISALAE